MCDCCPPTSKVSRTVYVSSCTGSNRCGQPESPKHSYRSLDVAIGHAEPGWTVFVLPGHYTGSASLRGLNLIAEPETYIEVVGSEFVDGVVSFTGQAQLTIPPGSTAQLRFIDEGYFRVRSLVSWGRSDVAPVSVRFAKMYGEAALEWKRNLDIFFTEKAATYTQERLFEMLAPTPPLPVPAVPPKKPALLPQPYPMIKLGAKTAINYSGGVVAYSEGNAHWMGINYQSADTVVHFAAGSNQLNVEWITGPEQTSAAVGIRAAGGTRMTIEGMKAGLGVALTEGPHTVKIASLGSLTSPVNNGWRLEKITTAHIQCDLLYALEQAFYWEASTGGYVTYIGTQIGDVALTPQTAITVERKVMSEAAGEGNLTMEVAKMYAYDRAFSVMAKEEDLWPEFNLNAKVEIVRVFPRTLFPAAAALPNVFYLHDAYAKLVFVGNRIDHEIFPSPATPFPGIARELVPSLPICSCLAIDVRRGRVDLVVRELNSAGDVFGNGDNIFGLIDSINGAGNLFAPPANPVPEQPSSSNLTAGTVTVGGSAIVQRATGGGLPQFRMTIGQLQTAKTAFDLAGNPARVFYTGTNVVVGRGVEMIRDTISSDVSLSVQRATGSTRGPFIDLGRALPGASYTRTKIAAGRGAERLIQDTTASDVTISVERATGSTVGPFIDLGAALPEAKYYLRGRFANLGGPGAVFTQAVAARTKLHSVIIEAAPDSYAIGISDATNALIQLTSGTVVVSSPGLQPGVTLSPLPPGSQIKELAAY